jgi:hypothetical protein
MAVSGLGVPIVPLPAYGLGPKHARPTDDRRKHRPGDKRADDEASEENAKPEAGVGGRLDVSV